MFLGAEILSEKGESPQEEKAVQTKLNNCNYLY